MENKDNFQKWIAVYTKPRHEKIVENELRNKGFEVYLPILKEKRKWSDRKKWIDLPLFKSYIFVLTDIKNALFIMQTIGVVRIVKSGEQIAIIKNDNIKAIKLMLEGGYLPTAIDYFEKGESVEVKEGPLKGLIGEIKRVNNQDRLLVRVDAIQHSISVQINRAFLKHL